MGHVVIEIKARSHDNDRIRNLLKSRNADFRGIDHQIDTYFKTNNGRLKLREGQLENFLVYYERKNEKGPKQSKVTLVKYDSMQPIKDVLAKAFGVLVIVDKHREIYFIDNVKFHLDEVKDLGTFVEIECIDTAGIVGMERLLVQCNHYRRLFDIRDEDLIELSYNDLLLPSDMIQLS